MSPAKVVVLRRSFPSWTRERCEREIAIAKWIAQSKAGPEVLGVSKDSRFMLLEYFNGGVLHPKEFIDLKEFAYCLRNLHAVGLPPCLAGETHSTTFSRFKDQFKTVERLYAPLPEWLTDLSSCVKKVESELARYPERVLCHLDLHFHNIMRHDGKMMLVDYGMTGPDHPFVDLANFAMYLCLSPQQEKELLTHYLGRDLDDKSCKDYAFFRPLPYLNKITWNLIRAEIINKQGATLDMLKQVWEGESIVPSEQTFSRIYSQQECSVMDDLRYARSAFQQFYQKL